MTNANLEKRVSVMEEARAALPIKNSVSSVPSTYEIVVIVSILDVASHAILSSRGCPIYRDTSARFTIWSGLRTICMTVAICIRGRMLFLDT